MVDFFEPLKTFLSLLQLGQEYEEHLKLLEKKFITITILFQKFEKVLNQIIHLPTLQERIPM